MYRNHYEEYIKSIFNIRKRTFNYTAQLPLHIITKLELNDVLIIKEKYYRIDKYSYNLLTGKTTLNLINSFDDTVASPKVNPTLTKHQDVRVDYRVQTETVLVTNSLSLSPVKVDQGSGTTWATLSNTGNNIHIAFDEFTGSEVSQRVMLLQFITGAGTENIWIYQTAKAITADVTTITADTTLTTADNG